MVDDPDIWRAANLLLRRYGVDATIRAAQCADELFADGDSDGYAIWKRISRPWTSSPAPSQLRASG